MIVSSEGRRSGHGRRSTCRDEIWDKVPEGDAFVLDIQIYLKHSVLISVGQVEGNLYTEQEAQLNARGGRPYCPQSQVQSRGTYLRG